MHANNVRATLYRQQGCGNAGHHSLIDLQASHGTQRRFARPPCQQGVTVSQNSAWCASSEKFCSTVLPKPTQGPARCDLAVRPSRTVTLQTPAEAPHLKNNVAIHGRGLHGLRIAVHVHQADTASRVRSHDRLCTRLTQRPDVVDDVGAQVSTARITSGL